MHLPVKKPAIVHLRRSFLFK
uniref:Uncharacterized protein n=1 Tax=Anguilla anguilla TaxID=7936 RepID=A0A0E9VP45_ANGAN